MFWSIFLHTAAFILGILVLGSILSLLFSGKPSK